jgi:hypothetical protein
MSTRHERAWGAGNAKETETRQGAIAIFWEGCGSLDGLRSEVKQAARTT